VEKRKETTGGGKGKRTGQTGQRGKLRKKNACRSLKTGADSRLAGDGSVDSGQRGKGGVKERSETGDRKTGGRRPGKSVPFERLVRCSGPGPKENKGAYLRKKSVEKFVESRDYMGGSGMEGAVLSGDGNADCKIQG